MKNNLFRIISSILILAFLVSCFAIYATAEEGGSEGEEEEDDGIEIVYYRNYEEGWGYENGLPTLAKVLRGNIVEIRHEETKTFDYNYYMYMKGVETTHTYTELKYSAPISEGYTVYEYDIKIDDYSDFRGENILSLNMGSGVPARTSATIRENVLYLPEAGVANSAATYKVGALSPKSWIHVAMVFCLDYRACSCGTINSAAGINDYNSTKCTNTECEVVMMNMEPIIELTVYFSGSETFDSENAIDAQELGEVDKDLSKTYKYTTVYRKLTGEENNAPFGSIISISFQLPKKAAQIGQNFCFDNLAVYNGSPVPIDIAARGDHGYLVDTSKEPTMEIIGGADVLSNSEHVDKGLVMKVGVDNALKAGKKEPILYNEETGNAYGAPVSIDGKIFVPVEPILENMGRPIFAHPDGKSYDISTGKGSTFIAVGRDTATVNGKLVDLTAAPAVVTTDAGDKYVVIALDDVERLLEGRFVTYDDMGLIVIADKDNVISRSVDFEYMLELMQGFVFDEKSGDEIYNLAKEKTGFDHPYLIANDADFAAIRAAYAKSEGSEGYDANYKKLIDNAVNAADAVYAEHANDAGGLKAAIANPRVPDNNAGYNKYSGQLTEIADYAAQVRDLALAYQITENSKYASLAYEMALSLGQWEHWGPGDIHSFSAAVTAYALCYDWLYDAWVTLGYDITKIETALYEKGIYQGYNISLGICVFSPLIHTYIDPYYNKTTSSKNIVGTSGMMIASLALLGAKDIATAEGRYDEGVHDSCEQTSKWLLENNMKTLVADGLDCYAPDGAFPEGPTMWAKATNALFTLAWSLETSTGSDMGLFDTWGLDKTFYYATQIEYPAILAEVAGTVVDNTSGYLMWNYNNSEAGYVDTSIFYYAAEALGDNNLAALRNKQLEKKSISYLDLLGYKTSYSALDPNGVELSLDYKLEGVQGAVSRDSWSDGCLYVGIMGGSNSGAYAQLDSGNFIYANKGFTWFGDMGAENSECYGTVESEQAYKYYRANAEGANVVCIVADGDIPYGQLDTADGKLIKYETNEYGMYAVIDNSTAYGEIVNSANRGILFTNNRKTVIVQDEISFSGGVHSAVWVANTTARITVSDDMKTAYLRQRIGGEEYILRATIVSTYDFVFEKLSATDNFLLPNTMKENGATALGGKEEYKRSEYSRLVIRAEDRLGFECAVVFEMVDSVTSQAPVEYEYTNISKWEITEKFVASVSSEATRTPELNDVVTFAAQAGRLVQQQYAFTSKLDDFFYSMAIVQAAVKTYRPAYLKNFKEVYSAYLDYVNYLEQYDVFKKVMNEKVEMGIDIGAALCGIN